MGHKRHKVEKKSGGHLRSWVTKDTRWRRNQEKGTKGRGSQRQGGEEIRKRALRVVGHKRHKAEKKSGGH